MKRENLRIGDLEHRSEHRINLVKRKKKSLFPIFLLMNFGINELVNSSTSFSFVTHIYDHFRVSFFYKYKGSSHERAQG